MPAPSFPPLALLARIYPVHVTPVLFPTLAPSKRTTAKKYMVCVLHMHYYQQHGYPGAAVGGVPEPLSERAQTASPRRRTAEGDSPAVLRGVSTRQRLQDEGHRRVFRLPQRDLQGAIDAVGSVGSLVFFLCGVW